MFALRGVKPGLFARALRALALRAVQRRARKNEVVAFEKNLDRFGPLFPSKNLGLAL